MPASVRAGRRIAPTLAVVTLPSSLSGSRIRHLPSARARVAPDDRVSHVFCFGTPSAGVRAASSIRGIPEFLARIGYELRVGRRGPPPESEDRRGGETS